MTWQPTRKRWVKKYRGKQYLASQRQLRLTYTHLWEGPTKELSYKAANQFWKDRLATLQQHPCEAQINEAIEQRKLAAEWCCLAGDEDTRKRLLSEADSLKHARENATALEHGDNGLELDGMALDLCWRVAGFDSPWPARIEEAKRHLDATKPEEGNSLSAYVTTFLKYKEAKVVPKKYREIKRSIEEFQEWWKCDNVEMLRKLVVLEYSVELEGRAKRGEISDATAASKLKNVKMLVFWLHEMAEVISLPPGMNKIFISVGDTDNRGFTVDEVKTLLGNCSEEQKLHYLLMANCGMTQGDVGQFKKTEIDLEAGTITRRRSKRENGGLTVTWQLWDVTLDLLRKHLSDHPTLALTDADGSVLYDRDTDKDKIGNRYRSIKTKHDLPELKRLRKTGSNFIADNFDQELADYFLAHGADTVGAKHYIAHQNGRLAKATEALREHLGL